MAESYSRINISVYGEDLARFERLADQMERDTGTRPNRSELIRLIAIVAERKNLLAGRVFGRGRGARSRKPAA